MSTFSEHHSFKPAQRWLRSPLVVALWGSLLLWLAQPPVGWSFAAWAAPLPWLYLATQSPLAGQRPYLQIWLAGFVYWMLALHWIRLAHPATFFGLLLLAAYLAAYLPLFVWVVRVGVKKLNVPVWLIAPVAWVATEWLEGNVLGGFLMAAVSHTQIDQPRIVQIADLGGAYLVSALVMLVAACASELAFRERRAIAGQQWRPAVAILVAASALLAAHWYGGERIATLTPAEDAPTLKLALVQGNERAVWTADPDRDKRVMDHYLELTRQAARDALEQEASIDLMVWPEGAFRVPLYSYPPEYATPELQKAAAYAPNDLKSLQQLASAPLLVGLDRIHFTDPNSAEIYNACAAVDDEGQLLGTYDKTHLVMFGEYVPLTDLWPGLYDYFPIGGVTPGREPAAFDIGGVRYMPTICYETTIPHVVREQVAQLTAAQARPDVLVNITNDSWFYDSSELRMHLACSRLRAIECRTPLVAAANGGLSANIDCCGRVLAVSQAMQPQVLLVDVVPGGHDSPYLGHGDAFAIGSLVVTLVISIAGGVIARKSKKAPPTKAIG